MLSFFILATSLLSESMVSFDPLCGIAARKETMKLAGLRLRVIWTLPVFSYLNLGKIERKNWARSVKRMRASFLLPWFTHDRDKKLRAGARSLRRAPFCLSKYFYYIENIAEQYSYITTKVPCEAVLIHERHMRIEISDFVMRAFVPIQGKDSSHAVFFHFGNVSTFRKYGFLRSSMRHRRKEGNHETCRTAPARYMDVAGFLLPWFR